MYLNNLIDARLTLLSSNKVLIPNNKSHRSLDGFVAHDWDIPLTCIKSLIHFHFAPSKRFDAIGNHGNSIQVPKLGSGQLRMISHEVNPRN